MSLVEILDLAGVAAFAVSGTVVALELFDAIGLGLFAAVGAERAGSAGIPVQGSIAIGVVAALLRGE